jgi:nucleotide-binding universal stress UspA family protein
MFQRILVPVDGSKRAERAIPVATRIARACGGTVILVRVVNAASEGWPSLAGEPTLLKSVVDADKDGSSHYFTQCSTPR